MDNVNLKFAAGARTSLGIIVAWTTASTEAGIAIKCERALLGFKPGAIDTSCILKVAELIRNGTNQTWTTSEV